MYNVPVPRFPSHWRNFWATNSGPLSDRMCSGIPRHSITSDNVSITSEAAHPSLHSDRQAFPPILVQQRQQPQRPSIVRSGANKVIAPYVVAPLRPQSYTGTVVQPQSSSRPVFLRHFQPLSPPDPLDPILTHLPACPSQQRRNPPVAIAAVVRCQGNDGLCQFILVSADAPVHIVAFLSIAPAASRRAAHSSRTRARHAPPHNAAAQGSEVSLRHIPQYLLLYRQLRH